MLPLNRLFWIRLAVLIGLVWTYFVIFPDDLSALLTPVPALLVPIEKILSLSFSISPWFYLVVAVVILAWTINRIWGRRTNATMNGPM